MRNNEFSKLYGEMKDAFAKCQSIHGLHRVANGYIKSMRECERLNPTLAQKERLSNLFNCYVDILTNTNTANTEKGTNEMSKNEEVKTEATETTAPAVIADAAPADVKKLEAAVSRVQKKIDKIAKSYIEIIGDVALLYEDKNFKALGYKNIYDLAKDKFGMSRGTVNNLLSVYSRFGENYKLKDEYKDMSLRELLDHIHKEKAAQRTLEIGEDIELDEVTDGDDEEAADGNGAGGKKGKKETLVKFDFDTIDAWTVDELIEKFREELGDGFTIPANAHINFVVTE